MYTENQLYSLALKNSEKIRDYIRKYVYYFPGKGGKTYILKDGYTQKEGVIRYRNFDGKDVVYERETLKNIWLAEDKHEDVKEEVSPAYAASPFAEGYLQKILTNLIEEVDGFIQACLLFDNILPGKKGEIEKFKKEAVASEKENNFIRVTDEYGNSWDIVGSDFPLPDNVKTVENFSNDIVTFRDGFVTYTLYPRQCKVKGGCILM